MGFLGKLGNVFEDAASFAVPAGLFALGTFASGGNPLAGKALMGAAAAGGAGFSRNEEEERMRKAQRQAKQNQIRANVINALNPRAGAQARPVEMPKAGLLETVARGGAQGYQLYNQAEMVADAAKTRKLKQEQAQASLDEFGQRQADREAANVHALGQLGQPKTGWGAEGGGFSGRRHVEPVTSTSALPAGISQDQAGAYLAALQADEDRARQIDILEEDRKRAEELHDLRRKEHDLRRKEYESTWEARAAQKQLDRDTLTAETESMQRAFDRLASGKIPLEDVAANEDKLRKDYTQLTSAYRDVGRSYKAMQSLAENPSPMGDIGLMFAYMKMLDPKSTVREGEKATVEQAGNIPTRVWQRYNKMVDGTGLTVEQRVDLVRQAGALYGAQEDSFRNITSQFEDIIERRGLTPGNVLVHGGSATGTDDPMPLLAPPGAAYDDPMAIGGAAAMRDTLNLGQQVGSVEEQLAQLDEKIARLRGAANQDTLLPSLGRVFQANQDTLPPNLGRVFQANQDTLLPKLGRVVQLQGY